MTQSAARPAGLSAYIAVTAAYWAFMLTDGALRMLVLLHFHTLGFSPVQLAYLFVLYEIAGVITNLCAGWIAARFGLTSTLYAGCRVAFKSETRRFRHRVLPLIARFGCHGAFASRPPLRNLINCGKQTWLLLESAQKSNLCIVVDAGA